MTLHAREFLFGLFGYTTIAIVFLFVCSDVFAGNVTLNWTYDTTPAATCADGTASSNCTVTAFEVQELINTVWTAKPQALSPTLRAHVYQNVSAGKHCYRLRANANGAFSDPSNESCLDVPVSAPKAPVITVTIAVGSPAP